MLPAADACRQRPAAWQAAQHDLMFLLLLLLVLLLLLLLLLPLLLLVTSLPSSIAQMNTNSIYAYAKVTARIIVKPPCLQLDLLPCPALLLNLSLYTALASGCQFVLLIKRISKCKIHSRGVPFDARSTLDLLPLFAGKSRRQTTKAATSPPPLALPFAA